MTVAPAALIVTGLPFGRPGGVVAVVPMGVCPTPAGHIIPCGCHLHRNERPPTGIRERDVGFVHAWSRLSAIFTALILSFILEGFGATGVFTSIAAAMPVVAPVIGPVGPRTRNTAFEEVSH